MKIQARQYVGAWLVCVLVFSLVYYGLWYTDQAEHREKLAEAESRCNKIFQEASRSFNQEFQARAIFSEIHEALIPLFAPDGTASSPAVPFPVDDDVVQTVDQACGKTGFKPIVIYGTTGSEPRLIGHDLSQQRPVSPIAIKAAQTLATMFDALEKRRFDTQAFNQYVRTFETEMEAGQHPEEYRRLRTVFGPGFHLITHKAFGSQRGIRSIPYFGRNAFFYWGWLGQPYCGRIVFLGFV